MAIVNGKFFPKGMRHEVKFLIPPAVKVAVRYDVGSFSVLDSHAQGDTGTYAIRSLYMDSLDRASYFEKLDGVLLRRKFRIRVYLPDLSKRNLEIKGRFGDRIFKRKAALTQKQYEAIISGHNPDPEGNDEVLREYWVRRAQKRMSPLVNIDYVRTAYFGRSDSSVRITFDADIRAMAARSLDTTLAASVPVFPRGAEVLEIKFDNLMPFWVHGIVKKYSLQNLAVSKYCLGVDSLIESGRIPFA